MVRVDRQLKVLQLVAQSTVSHAIATLETDLGVVLLLCHRSRAVLTLMGTQICQQAREVLAQLVRVAILENAVLPRAVFVFLDVLLALPVGE